MSISEYIGIDGDELSLLAGIVGREVRDFPDVLAHEERVAAASVAIAAELGMTDAEQGVVRLAARLHDVGKMLIPSNILRKPSMFDAEERAVMETHAAKGAEMLRIVPGLPQAILDGARYHHERYDGFGYEKLLGEDIPYVARIIAVADVFDALSSKRDYKPALPEGEVLGIMTADVGSGRQLGRRAFDPVVLRAFVSLRLSDPKADISEADRLPLEDYVKSNPMDDLSEELARFVSIDFDGRRSLLDDEGAVEASVDRAGRMEATPASGMQARAS